MVSAVILLAVTLAWFGFSFFLSHQNGADTAQTSLEISRKIYNFLSGCGMFDEDGIFAGRDLSFIDDMLRHAAHVMVFFVMTLLICISLKVLFKNTKIKIPARAGFIFCILWSIADEASKIPVQGRHFSWRDVALNAAGCAAAGLLLAVIFLIKEKKRRAAASEKKAPDL